MEMLLEACPSFAPRYGEFLERWERNDLFRNADGSYDVPYCLAMDALARHLVAKLEAGEDDMILRVFGQIERLILYADDHSYEVIGMCLLEYLQDLSLYQEKPGLRPEDFRRFMQPETEHFWNALCLFGYGKRLPEGIRIGKRDQALIDRAEAGQPILPNLSVWNNPK